MRRIAKLVHSSPGRLRLRMAWLRQSRGEAGPLSERLSQIHGVQQIEIRPYTGSVLCLHDPLVIETDALLEEIRRAASLEGVLHPEDPVPLMEMDTFLGRTEDCGTVGRALHTLFRDLNRDLMHSSEGKLDLRTATALAFVAVAALEMAASRQVSMPPWFNFGWWAYRTFVSPRPFPGGVANYREVEAADVRQGELPFDAPLPH